MQNWPYSLYMKYIPRDLEKPLSSFLKTDKGEHIVLISGARQTGKSTLAETFPAPEKNGHQSLG
jgi:predicted AAA+ superfamily ATPase